MSLQLEGGRVVFRYSMGTSPEGGRRRSVPAGRWEALTTTNKYNTNEWVTARATFSQAEGEAA